MSIKTLQHIALGFVFQIIAVPIFSQQIKGTVTDMNSVLLDYFNVEILNRTDSSTVKSGTFANGKFIFNNLARGKYLLKLSSLGYSTLIVETEINTQNTYIFRLK